MKTPDIDPELHGLLDEVVTDPRSALRRTPRRALLTWFTHPDSAHARPIDATTAERHLVAVYRESLAELLLKASWLAFHRQPVARMSPRRPDGSPVDMQREASALQAAVGRTRALDYGIAGKPEALGLLTASVASQDPDQAAALAEMAVALVPSDFGRLRWAAALPESEQGAAIQTLQQLAHTATASFVRKDAHNAIALRMVDQGWLHLAREEYHRAIEEALHAPEARFWAFNLACWAGDRKAALEQAQQIESLCEVGDERLREAEAILRAWRGSSPLAVAQILRHARAWMHELPEQGLVLIRAYS